MSHTHLYVEVSNFTNDLTFINLEILADESDIVQIEAMKD